MRWYVPALLALSLTAPVTAVAQDETLADIRQELSALFVQIQSLRRELSTTGGVSLAVGGDTLQRIDLIEGALQRLTARTEELQFRIDRVVKDGTNRVGDLEFRLCELEPGCDIATLRDTPTLGGDAAVPSTADSTTALATVTGDTTEFAVGEQADFEAGLSALDEGDFTTAVTLLTDVVDNYPGGALTPEANFFRGEALTGLGDTPNAARAYLASFSGAPNGRMAADALVGLGTSLGQLGQQEEACVTLAEVASRFPGSLRVVDAEAERARLGCS
ncbi:TPR repeat containing exported protein [Candidatus Rhodobacter oscarellae]|uniref:Cell division coordinator CpoB n=1 Tax=Candidatus Rhodobacter oscarellae TaxID=1675527 RepID=A0A0J9E9L8_9RHOB|nr:tol-pal system protein YbgF [Candidatus Rhodobacter lobularis]KMW59480.1 TPR repeat containing exported protein [Candidatus Rhodobacter lobularis]